MSLQTKLEQLRAVSNLYYADRDEEVSIEVGLPGITSAEKANFKLAWVFRRGIHSHHAYSVYALISKAKNARVAYASLQSVEECADVLIEHFMHELRARAEQHQNVLIKALQISSEQS